MIRKFYLLLLFLGMSLVTEATHIVGGELYYSYLGSNQYRIHLVVYRDCFNGVPPFDSPAIVGIWNSNNVFLSYVNLFPSDSVTVPNYINSPCFIPPTNVCYRKCNYYSSPITLPPTPGGYQLAYQRCCRNQTIINIIDPLDEGATFYASIPGTGNFPVNDNPVFTVLPPSFICSGLYFEFDHSATDSDGDSLVYEICTPFDGASLAFPALDPTSILTHGPPYSSVDFQPPYNMGNLLGGLDPLSIDSQTGLLTATPITIGQFVIGICVNEYRNGVFLSKTRRDYQLNVVPCPTLVVAALQTPVLTCGSNTVQFVNNSFGASTYYWNFGDPATPGDTTHIEEPSYTYADTGSYSVTLIAYSTFNPACADTIVGEVMILPDYQIDFDTTLFACTAMVSFNDTSNTDSGVTSQWSWNFGDNSPIVNTPDPTHTFPGPGTYTVTLQTTSTRGCKETLVKTIVIPPYLTVSASSGQVTCNGLCTGQTTANTTNGNPNITYQWSNSQVTQTAVNLCPGTYTVNVIDGSGCTATATSVIGEPDTLIADASATDAYCEGMCIGTATILHSGGTSPVSIVWNDPQSQTNATASSLCPGMYTALVTDINGCSYIDSAEVIYSSFIPTVDATISDDTIFVGQSVNLAALTNGSFSYLWSPPEGLSSTTVQNPSANPSINSTYYVTITDAFGCSNLDSVSIAVREVFCEEPEIFIPNAFTPNSDSNNDIMYVRGNTIRELDFKIFDRWGEKVFESNDPKIGWDGSYKGKIATPAVYVYYVEAVCYNNEKFFKKGNITLIR